MSDYKTWRDNCFVYFIKPVGKSGPIKIGCSQTPDARLTSINSWAPYPLELLAVVSGSFELERRLHRCFSAFHSHGEWFHSNDALVAGISALKNGIAIEDAFDLSYQGDSIWLKKRPINWTEAMRIRRGYISKVHWAIKRLNKKAPDEYFYSAPESVQDLFSVSCGPKGLTDEQISHLEEFLKNPEKTAEKIISVTRARLR